MGWQDDPVVSDAGAPWERDPVIDAKPKPIGQAANADFLKEELKNAGWFGRNLAAAGTAITDPWEGLKQLFGQGDRDKIEANKVIRDSAPVGAIAGDIATMAIPMAAVGTSVKGAALVGGAFGAARPTDADGWQGLKERFANAGMDAALSGAGQAAVNVGGKYLARKMADTALERAQKAPRDQVLAEAQDLNLKVPPSSVDPTWLNTLKESFAGKTATAQEAAVGNASKFEQAARRDLHLADDVAVTPEAAQAAREQAYQLGYKPIEQIPAINWNPEFIKGVDALSPKGKGGAVRSPAQSQIDELLASLKDQNQWTGEQLVRDIRALREQSRANYGAANRAGGDAAKTDLARVQGGAADLLEKLATDNLGDATLVTNLRAARRIIAKSHDVEDALIPGGGVDARKWAKNAEKMDGQMGVAARFAAQFPKASQTSQQIAGPGVNKLGAFMLPSAAGLVGEMVGGHEGGVPGVIAGVVGPALMRRHLLSNRVQRNVLRDLYSSPAAAGVNALRVLPYSPAALAQARSKPLPQ
jgi:hypothetical protein